MVEPAALPHVVIVGGGFGGLYAARALAGRPVRVTLLDRRNYHLFQPLLYQVATAALNPSDIATPLRSILREAANVTVLLAHVDRVELDHRRLVLDRAGHRRVSRDRRSDSRLVHPRRAYDSVDFFGTKQPSLDLYGSSPYIESQGGGDNAQDEYANQGSGEADPV